MSRRHKWLPANAATGDECVICELRRRRPMSAIRRGRPSVSDWDYWIDGQWVRHNTVPQCPGFKVSEL